MKSICVSRHVQKVTYYIQNIFTVKTLKKRIPILEWAPKYTIALAVQDIIAGITVGLTSIPQGLAFAAIANLPPEYGLYSGLMGGIIYMIFGKCKDASIGPTAIIAGIIAKYISGYSSDFAILAAFLSGIIEILMGLLHLGFLVQYISKPVISGFTNAASFQIITSQFKPFFGHKGPAGYFFQESIESFIKYVNTSNVYDLGLGFFTLIILVSMQWFGQEKSKPDSLWSKIKGYVSLSRNVLVVVLSMVLAYCLSITNVGGNLTLIGEIKSGLPTFQVPPLSTIVKNQTYNFEDMIRVLGPQSIAIPLVAILELVALASAFSDGTQIDASQEMIALGLCNLIGSFAKSMPLTSSFSRGAMNRASGAQTPACGIFTCLFIILSLTLLTSTFSFIPTSTLAAMIIMAMCSIINFAIFGKLWKECKGEFFIMLITIAVCLFVGLEYGILAGVFVQALVLLYNHSKPFIDVSTIQSEKGAIILVQLPDNLSYCGADYVRRIIFHAAGSRKHNSILALDGNFVKKMDFTTVSSLLTTLKDLSSKGYQIKLANFTPEVKSIFLGINPESEDNFIYFVNPREVFTNTSTTTNRFSVSVSKL